MSYKNYIQNLRKDQITITVQTVTYDDKFNSTLSEIILRLNDIDVLPELPENLNNYYTWSGIHVKKYLKKQNYKGTHKLTWLVGEVSIATLIVNCDTDRDKDAPVYQ